MRLTLSRVALLGLGVAMCGGAAAQNVAPPAAEVAVPSSAPAPAQQAQQPPAQEPSAQEPSAPAATAASPGTASPGPIAALQQQLKEAGYNPGPINGVMTDRTRQVLAAYARRAGRPPAEADPIKDVQAGLRGLGLFAGASDGVVGPQTRDAIIRFEAAHHLAIDPRVSDRLLAELDKAGAFAGGTSPTPTIPPSSAAAEPASPAPPPDATGRQPLPPGVTPPPIR